MTDRRKITRFGGVALAVALWALGSGCVTVYQPMTGLQRPVVVDPQLANFEGVRLLLRCAPGDYLSASDAQLLCRRVGALFRNQGAEVDVDIPRPGRAGREFEEGERPELIVDLKARLLHHEDHGVLYLLAYMTATLVPTMEEFTVAQDVTIRDARGFLLASDTLQARFVRYFGVGIWAVNWALDLGTQNEADKLSGDAAAKNFSRDFYGQLSQLVFNARTRAVVLRGFEQPAAAPASAGAN